VKREGEAMPVREKRVVAWGENERERVGGLVGEINSRRGREKKKKERSCNIPIFLGQILNLTWKSRIYIYIYIFFFCLTY
jgi:hypothetical protein